jgi:hypothetical protein
MSDSDPPQFSGYSGTVYLKVVGRNSSTGTYAIKYSQSSGSTGGDTLTLSNGPTAYAVYVTTTTLTGSSTYTGVATDTANLKATGSGSGNFANLSWISGGSGSYNVLIYAGTETRYQNSVSFSNGSASLNWNSMSTASGGGTGTSGTLTITGLPSGTYSVFAVNGNPATYLDCANLMLAAPGQGAVISGTMVTWSMATPPTGTYTILLASATVSTNIYKATNVSITDGGGSVAYSAFSGPLPMGY